MKKTNYLSLAMLSLLMVATSCESERAESNTDEQISFGVAIGKQTASRASEFSYWAANGELKVKSYQTGQSTPLKEFTLTYNGSSAWTVDPTMNQPGYSINYYSWYPTDELTSFAYNGTAATFSYTIPAVASQVDLIAAMNSTNSATVSLAFYHILSQVNFAVQGIANVKINISSISITGVNNAGVYTYSTDATTGGSWASQEGSAEYVYAPKAGANHEVVSNTTDVVYLGNGGGTNNNTNALMLMPQTHTGEGRTISIGYTITDLGDNPLASGTATADLAGFTTTTWAMGKRYLYVVDFTGLLTGDPITFNVTVLPWTDATPAEDIEP